MKKRGRPERTRPAVAVSIAASDSGGGAGIQADLLTFAAHGVYGATVLTAGTAQNTRGVTAIEPFSPRFLARQIDAVFTDLRPRAVKIGMLFDAPRIRAVAAGLERHRAPNVVLDPVMVAKSGARLLSRAGAREPAGGSCFRSLRPRDAQPPRGRGARAACGSARTRTGASPPACIADLGARAVLLKGGHGRGAVVRDLLFDGRFFTEFVAPRIRTRATHGTGCTLSSAIAANLALGPRPRGRDPRGRSRTSARGLARGLFPGGGFGVPDHFAGRLRPAPAPRYLM